MGKVSKVILAICVIVSSFATSAAFNSAYHNYWGADHKTGLKTKTLIAIGMLFATILFAYLVNDK